MNYNLNPKNGESLSLLGLGCMRFTKKGTGIDQEKAEREMLRAIELGVNYFDTAYIYPGSEESVGTFLAKGYRDQVNIATKLPHYFVKSATDPDKYFKEQLRRLRTDHIEYYLIHMLNDVASWDKLKALGIEDWIAEKKQSGQIRNLGFSFHGGAASFQALIDAYDWDFCQIQYNYVDQHAQAGEDGLHYAASKGLPVIIMEPLRGGRLTEGLPENARAVIDTFEPKHTPAYWALRWLWDQPEVTVVLSGMNSMEQIEENCAIASSSAHSTLTEQELALFPAVRAEIRKKVKVGCTGCSYCMPCPKGVDIPVCFNCYNARYSEGWYTGMKEYFMCTTLRINSSAASQCVQCGKCETHCPQGIAIREELKHVTKTFETPIFKVLRFAAKRLGYC